MKYILNILAILIVIFLIKVVIDFKNNPDNKFNEFLRDNLIKMSDFFKTKKQNISVEINPQRKRPFNLIEKEVILREFDPETFGEFTEKDWEDFWSIIYTPIKKKKGNLYVLSFRDREELEAKLLEKYPRPFIYFDKNYWDIFWRDIIGIRFENEQ